MCLGIPGEFVEIRDDAGLRMGRVRFAGITRDPATEGEDEPPTYPHLFQQSELMLLSMIDLLPHLDFDVEQCVANARRVNPQLAILPLSTRSGEGLDDGYGFLRGQRAVPLEAR